MPGTVILVKTEWTREPVPESRVVIFWLGLRDAMRTWSNKDVPDCRVIY